eukprot:GEZU01032430.1.p1 GENE.GEZU01032430.1~~GEZU01032430.1.p1  ORF type:complete len:166 (-),score=51.98 GEZU01032430.1:35-532(-)
MQPSSSSSSRPLSVIFLVVLVIVSVLVNMSAHGRFPSRNNAADGGVGDLRGLNMRSLSLINQGREHLAQYYATGSDAELQQALQSFNEARILTEGHRELQQRVIQSTAFARLVEAEQKFRAGDMEAAREIMKDAESQLQDMSDEMGLKQSLRESISSAKAKRNIV